MPSDPSPLVLIPAAGYGLRMGRPPAKELLPGSSGEPMIRFSLRQAQRLGWPALVITRLDKKELIEYLKSIKADFPGLELSLVEATRDWPETLLASERHWREQNLVVLPDTEWDPNPSLSELGLGLTEYDVVFGTHRVEDVSTWGIMRMRDERTLEVCEKPRLREGGLAWGLFGFRATMGRALLAALAQSNQDHRWRSLPARAKDFPLRRFRDLTRPVYPT